MKDKFAHLVRGVDCFQSPGTLIQQIYVLFKPHKGFLEDLCLESQHRCLV